RWISRPVQGRAISNGQDRRPPTMEAWSFHALLAAGVVEGQVAVHHGVEGRHVADDRVVRPEVLRRLPDDLGAERIERGARTREVAEVERPEHAVIQRGGAGRGVFAREVDGLEAGEPRALGRGLLTPEAGRPRELGLGRTSLPLRAGRWPDDVLVE